MPSHLSADRPAAQPPPRGSVDALISQTRRLRGEMDAVRRDAPLDGTDPQGRWQRALCDLAMHQLDDLDQHLAQLRDGPPPVPAEPARAPAVPAVSAASRRGSLLSRVGSAEWNLLTDEASWSGELYDILGRDPAAPPLTLDELPSLMLDEDRPMLTAMVTDCLIDAKPIDGEFRIVCPDGGVRTVHMMGEPVLDIDGSTAAMWAVLRDVSELRRSQRTVSESRESLQLHRHHAQSERRLAVQLQEAVLPPWRGSLRFPQRGPEALDLAARHLPSSNSALIGGDWYDAMELPDGATLLSVGDLTGQGVTVASGMAMLLGALRGMAVAGTRPGQLMSWLNQLLDASVQPSLGSAVCCRYRPETRTLTWAQAGHPAPLLFRNGTGRMLAAPDGVLLGATSGAVYGQAEETLEDGDLLLLHTDGLVPGHYGEQAVQRLLDLAPRFRGARTAQDCVRTVVEEFGESEREDDACVLIARIGS
ncbi:SpoIIE family protein phosphatase [Streptomyces sp. RLB3-17]|uniref:SpoIIE family protein phosphatase n=1 Tax=Streptomyces mirabilis TaxID=68239 RepID=A0ABU3V0F3_9ACTN|nr:MULTISPECIES: PP2C family protein-serine/threonine phosphatase [Streptomyces]MCX4616235.1 SpoIIE family protein phosphatase [Streptomyces mirabilis]MCX5347002.1 SpoIIE family protein phosphatase [Streptomyces mirabilis]MDU8999659.1 SpoIIE family protein phosphatase [Streptomyces mirabilis]QDN74437.1 SpoIIE family protein phosphatase [Streptomyces sp. S1A1-7]QDN76061.1 SpoIIE family protein phosphatase [Streptomyces sp. S1A1-7]